MHDLPPLWRAALARRREILETTPCVRLLHLEDERFRCDRFGEICWGYWYGDDEPAAHDLRDVGALAAAAGAGAWHVHGMGDRGRDPSRRRHWSSDDAPDRWSASEDGLTVAMRADQGQSPGLFLDQRENRRWVRQHAEGRRIANLFAYTGFFGVTAAAGGAEHVEQVDVSRPYLAWAEQNAVLNELAGRISHSPVDARRFLDGCRKRDRCFDGIICDPPSFARGRRGESPFRVVDDLPDLVRQAFDRLAPGGWLLVTSNHEGLTQRRMHRAVSEALSEADVARIEAAHRFVGDYEPPGEEPLLKGLVVWKRQAG